MPDPDETLPEGLDGGEEDSDDSGSDDAGDDANQDSDEDGLTALRKEFVALQATQKQMVEAVNQTLKREVGRIQSLEAKLTQTPDTSDPKLQAEIGSVAEALSDALMSVDDSALDPVAKQKLAAATAERKREAGVSELQDRLEAGLKQLLDERLGQQDTTSADQASTDSRVNDALALETEVVREFADYGLDPDDYDWEEAKSLYATGGAQSVRSHVRTKIAEALREDGAATRRQKRKDSAGETPESVGGTKTLEAKLHESAGSVGLDILREMGIRIS